MFNKYIETAVRTAIDFDSPFYKSFPNLTLESKIELMIFNLCYSWSYIIENKFVEITEYNMKVFFTHAMREIRFVEKARNIMDKESEAMDDELFVNILFDRLESYAKELPLIIKHHMDIEPYFPKYFYFYIMDKPLVFEEDMKKPINYFDESIGLYDKFIQHRKYIQDKLKMTFKN